MLPKLLQATLNPDSNSLATSIGHLVFRVAVGLLIFCLHGWHKAVEWIAYLRHGTPWSLAGEVAEMHFPAPFVSAAAATLVQFGGALFLIVGWFTRLNAALLAGVLGAAILQNLIAGRDPQLAALYTLSVATLALMGGGSFSLDAKLFNPKAAS